MIMWFLFSGLQPDAGMLIPFSLAWPFFLDYGISRNGFGSEDGKYDGQRKMETHYPSLYPRVLEILDTNLLAGKESVFFLFANTRDTNLF